MRQGGLNPRRRSTEGPANPVPRSLDISSMSIADILLEIDADNGRLDTEAMIRGKPWV